MPILIMRYKSNQENHKSIFLSTWDLGFLIKFAPNIVYIYSIFTFLVVHIHLSNQLLHVDFRVLFSKLNLFFYVIGCLFIDFLHLINKLRLIIIG